jgi:ABC-type amino acid transport system permease subunit
MKDKNHSDNDEQQMINIYVTILAVPFILVAGYILASLFSLQEFFYPNKWGVPVSWLVEGIIGIPVVLLLLWVVMVKK